VSDHDFTLRARNRHGKHNGQKFLGGFGKGLAAIDSHREWRDVPEFVRRSKSDGRRIRGCILARVWINISEHII